MDEARRFLRYVTPGLLFGTIVAIVLLILLPGWTLEQLQSATENSGLGLAFTLLLASGGVGFLFGTFYHALHWLPGSTSIDHARSLENLRRGGVLELQSVETGDRSESPLTKDQAWILTTTLWHERLESSSALKGADSKVTALSDLTHSLGTAAVAVVAGAVVSFWIVAENSTIDTGIGSIGRFILAVLVTVAAIVALWTSYIRTAAFAQHVIDAILADALVAEHRGTGRPIQKHAAFRAKDASRLPKLTRWLRSGV